MCLLTKQIAPMKARKPIICYKVFELQRIPETSETWLVTPYLRKWMRLNREEKEDFVMPKAKIFENGILGQRPYIIVKNGFFHAYLNQHSALLTVNALYERWPMTNFAIVECEIPKDSLYFKDMWSRAICSTNIKPIKIIHECA